MCIRDSILNNVASVLVIHHHVSSLILVVVNSQAYNTASSLMYHLFSSRIITHRCHRQDVHTISTSPSIRRRHPRYIITTLVIPNDAIVRSHGASSFVPVFKDSVLQRVAMDRRWKPKPKARKHGGELRAVVPKGTVAGAMGLRTLAAHAIALCTPAVRLYEPRDAARRDEDMSGVESNDSRCASGRRRWMRSADRRARAPTVYEDESNDSRCASERRRRMRSADSRARELGRRSVSRAQR